MKIHTVLCILLCFLLIIVSTWTLNSFYKLQENQNTISFSVTYVNTGITTGWSLLGISVVMLVLFVVDLLRN